MEPKRFRGDRPHLEVGHNRRITMKTPWIKNAFAAAIVFPIAAAVAADRVPLTQAPEAVQKAIKEQSRGQVITEVERDTADGRTVYQVDFRREGIDRRVTFALDGTVLSRGTGVAAAVKDWFDIGPSLQLSQVPEPVQKTIREQQAGRTVGDIDKETWNGKTVFEVEFKEAGVNRHIYVDANGGLVVSRPAGDNRNQMMGTQLSETPQPVQGTVKRIAGSKQIEDVDIETRDGQTVYEVEIEQEGMNRHLQVAANGTVLKDSGQDRQRVRGEVDRADKTITLSQLPAAVQSTIKAQGDVTNLKPIQQELKDGQTVYKVEFEKTGLNKRLMIGSDGRIIEDR
jgi:uncharacterized membrane protein YkoI